MIDPQGSLTGMKRSNEETLEIARRLVAELEAGDSKAANETICQLADGGNNQVALFQEIGRLTRELHEAINGFMLDDAMAEMVQVDVPDATERLQYVIETTEQAAHQTLTAIELALPVSERLKTKAEHLNEQWGRFLQRELKLEDFKALSGELSEFLSATAEESSQLHHHMNEIMMAQGFQDITGQIIKKVIVLLKDVESRLVHLVKLAGHMHTSDNDEVVRKHKMANEDGPVVPGVTQSDVVSGQDDVDDLLSSLGF